MITTRNAAPGRGSLWDVALQFGLNALELPTVRSEEPAWKRKCNFGAQWCWEQWCASDEQWNDL